jgi:hypothetical protein
MSVSGVVGEVIATPGVISMRMNATVAVVI